MNDWRIKQQIENNLEQIYMLLDKLEWNSPDLPPPLIDTIMSKKNIKKINDVSQ